MPARTARTARPSRATRILDVALELFATKGFAGTTVTEIESAAGLTAGTGSFYRHFDSKEALFDAVLEREMALAATEHVRSAGQSPPPDADDRRARVLRDLKESLQNLTRREPLIRLLERDGDRLGRARDDVRRKMLDDWVRHQAVVLGLKPPARGSRGTRDDAVAVVVVAALLGYHQAKRFFGAPILNLDPDLFVETLADLVAPRAGER